MAFWQTSSIAGINEGVTPNDGTGDSVRDAFTKVGSNFSNISNFLSSTSIDYIGANISGAFNSSGHATVSNLSVANVIGITASITGNVTVGNITANTGLYSPTNTVLGGNTALTGQTDVYGLTVIHNNVVPSANLAYDLGTPTTFFRNIYAQGLVQVNTVTASSDAGLLQIHANLSPGDVKDVGVIGKFNQNSANSYAFFGFQYQSDNFVYKLTPNNAATTGNSVVYDGVYGNTQFGSQFLSNTTPSNSTNTGALIVAGGAGVAGNLWAGHLYGNITTPVANVSSLSVSGTVSGNLYIDGNTYSGGYQVVTTGILGTYGYPLYTGGVVTGSQIFLSAGASTSTTTGAVVVQGGVGVGGNVNAGAFYGPLNGNVVTAAQPYITSLGSLTNLTVVGQTNTNSLQATSIGATNITATGNVNVSTINGLVGLQVTGNTTSTGFVGTFYGPLNGQLKTNAQPFINSVGVLTNLNVTANTVTGNLVTSGTVAGTTGTFTNLSGILATNAQPYINTVGNLTLLNVDGNVHMGGNVFGTITTPIQPNITTVGTLTNLTVAGSANATTLGGTLTTAAQPNVTSVGNLLAIGSSLITSTISPTIAAQTPTIIDTFDSTVYGSAKYVVQLYDSVSPHRVQITELAIVHDRNGVGTVPYLNAYGSVYNLGVMGTFTTNFNGGFIQLVFTPNYTPTALVLKISRTAITL